jgi:hypothetical protein
MKQVFKINSATQQAANQKLNVIRGIIKRKNIGHDNWMSLLFELGYQFIERHIRDAETRDALLKDRTYRYWDWWMVVFINDDESILDDRNVKDLLTYTREKTVLIHLCETYDLFKQFLRSNPMIGHVGKI